MSTSPDAPKGENLTGRRASIRLALWDSSNPGVILLKGIFWLALVVGILIALGMNYDIVWDVLTGTVVPGLEVILETAEKLLDSFFLLVGVPPAFAPMATAYTGFVIILGLLYLVARKSMVAFQKFQAKKQELTALYTHAWDEWYGTAKATAAERFTAWWNALSFTDKIVAATFMVLVGIPLALLLSFILGSLVASLF